MEKARIDYDAMPPSPLPLCYSAEGAFMNHEDTFIHHYKKNAAERCSHPAPTPSGPTRQEHPKQSPNGEDTYEQSPK